MAAGVVPMGVVSGGELSGTEFGQRLSMSQQEQFAVTEDLFDDKFNTQHLEVYLHYAAIERKREAEDPRPIPDASWSIMFKTLIGKKDKIIWGNEKNPVSAADVAAEVTAEKLDGSDDPGEKTAEVQDAQPVTSSVTQEERDKLYRALRVASWQAVFYLITTDILGFTNATGSFPYLGYGPGFMTYFFLYLLAIGAGQIIWHLYLRLDSSRFPVICYADLGERTFGRPVRHLFNILQSFQLVFNVALLINGNAVTLAQLAQYKACFLWFGFVWFVVGVAGGQIQSLRNFAWFANCNIWLNIATMIMTMYGCATYLPNLPTSMHKHYGPIDTTAWVPSYTKGWFQQVQGVQYAVFAYGGAMIFPEFMAEMRKPRDFWKAAACAQFFCFAMYMIFGMVIYSQQGKYSDIYASINYHNRPLILANNIIGLLTIIVAAVLYGNIGVKVFYENVLRAYCKAPSMLTKKGRLVFSGTVFMYWGVAWVIAMGIPSLGALVTLVGAAFILQFTYTFPPLLLLGFWMQRDAMKADSPWVPGMVPGSNRVDTWRDRSRWVRGMQRLWYVKALLVLLFLAALANCGLGIYSGVEAAISAFSEGYGHPFSCIAPTE